MNASIRCTIGWAAMVCFVGLLGIAPVQAATIYVSPNGNDASDGLSWPSAKRQVQAGLNTAASGDQVWVAAGTYVENVTLALGVELYGGFAGTETDLTERNRTAHVTVLDGNQAYYAVTAPSGATETTRIDGFTIRNGRGGVSCWSSSPVIANNIITGNTGPGIRCSSSSPTILNNVITGNGADSGAGVYCEVSSAAIVNNTIAGNTASKGGGIYYLGSPPTIINTIIAFNSSGIWRSGGTVLPSLRNNCVYGNEESNYYGLTDQTGTNGNTSSDPRLANRLYGSVHIQPDSPCVDAGDDSAVQAGWVDMDGQGRIAGAHVDIGADESDGTSWPSGPNVIVRVSLSGNDANNGSSWALAKRTVQAGIDAAGASGGEVWVQAGTYFERITLRNHIHVYGGFAGTEAQRSQRRWAKYLTTLDGSQNGSVVTASGIGYHLTTIDGFTIRNGSGTLLGSGPPVGGGIFCRYASPLVSNNTIIGNHAWSGYGGGIYCTYSAPVIVDSIVVGNAAYAGGGIEFATSSRPTIANTLIAGNTSGEGGGISSSYSFPKIVDCTIVGNVGKGVYGKGGSLEMLNSIVAFNSSGLMWFNGYAPIVRSCCVYANTEGNYIGFTDPTGTNGNISADPRFVRPASDGGDGWGDNPATPGVDEGTNDDYGDLRLQHGSACIDAGENADVPADAADLDGDGNVTEPLPFDLAGGIRFADDPAMPDTGTGTSPIVDIGAYEYLCGDVSGDSHVDVVDLLYLAGAWGSVNGDATYNASCDFNHDGSVDIVDLLYLADSWGT